jgi:pimeloyl-ACP methyl ester carboxylesterase
MIPTTIAVARLTIRATADSPFRAALPAPPVLLPAIVAIRHRYPIGQQPTALRVNGVELCVQTFGDRRDAAILLIMGSGASMDWWENEFCERLASGPRFVIRYDHRDTGRSVSYEPGAPRYTGRDLVEDAMGVLDAVEVASAHVVGMSMGGALAQIVALDHPGRVTSLTLISTSPVTGDRAELPSMAPETVAAFAVDPPDWSNRQAVIEYMLHLARVSASPARRFDEAGFREFAGRVVDRTTSIEASMRNHDLIDSADPPTRRLEELRTPTLVIHGHDDPVLPFGHGEALAERIPGAELLPLEATGHELPRDTWDTVAPAILRQTVG